MQINQFVTDRFSSRPGFCNDTLSHPPHPRLAKCLVPVLLPPSLQEGVAELLLCCIPPCCQSRSTAHWKLWTPLRCTVGGLHVAPLETLHSHCVGLHLYSWTASPPPPNGRYNWPLKPHLALLSGYLRLHFALMVYQRDNYSKIISKEWIVNP